MEVFWVSATRRARDLSGMGARLHGGRWNHKGFPAVYASTSRSLASLEFLVHVPWGIAPADLSMISIFIPDDASLEVLHLDDLPAGWESSPPPLKIADLGTNWLMKAESLLLQVPTALVMSEWNLLINPAHPESAGVRIIDIEQFRYDPRLKGER